MNLNLSSIFYKGAFFLDLTTSTREKHESCFKNHSPKCKELKNKLNKVKFVIYFFQRSFFPRSKLDKLHNSGHFWREAPYLTSNLPSIFFQGSFFPRSKLNAYIRAFFGGPALITHQPVPHPGHSQRGIHDGDGGGHGDEGEGALFWKKRIRRFDKFNRNKWVISPWR